MWAESHRQHAIRGRLRQFGVVWGISEANQGHFRGIWGNLEAVRERLWDFGGSYGQSGNR